MTNERYEPTKAEFLAGIVTGHASLSQVGAAVQRSHRFPLSIFIEIENLARVAGVSVSVIINQLIECGLESVKNELPADVVQQLNFATPEQIARANKPFKENVKGRNLPETKSKPKGKKS